MAPLHIAGYEWLEWHLHPDVILLVFAMLASYWYAVTRWRPDIDGAGTVTRSQVTLYCTGVFVVYVAAGSPIHDISENYLLSMHMTQHMLLTLVAPPLLLAGIPTWVYQALLCGKAQPVANIILNPLLAIFTFNMVLVLTHLPETVDYALRNHWFHFVVHAAIFTTALQMWWPIVTRVPGLPQLSYPYQMAYLFVQSLVPSVIGAFITFSQSAVYEYYAEAPRIWGLSPVEDQQIAAFIMKVVGSLILWGFIGVAFFRWYSKEESADRGVQWREVEEELQQMGLTNPQA